MGLQKSVGTSPAIGVSGQKTVLGQSVYTTMNFLSDGTVKAGTFAFAPAAATTFAENVKTEYVTNKGTGLIGFVERTFTGAGASSDTYAQGEALTIAVRGDYYLVAPAAATTFAENVKTEYVTNKGTGLIGFVERTFTGAGASSDTYAQGEALTIAIRGDYYLKAPAGTTPTAGYKVITTDATGAISFAASASTGETDTGWTVTEGGSAGDIIVISNHG